jgi:hypothetical protein
MGVVWPRFCATQALPLVLWLGYHPSLIVRHYLALVLIFFIY